MSKFVFFKLLKLKGLFLRVVGGDAVATKFRGQVRGWGIRAREISWVYGVGGMSTMQV
jgi:hypothetical protein